MTITISVPDQLAEQAEHQGLSVEAFIARALENLAEQPLVENASHRSVAEAVDHIRESRKGITLGGLKIKDLIHEGHKY